MVVRDRDATTLWSRRGTDLTGRFPDVVDVAAAQVPAGTVLDGEVVVWVDDRLEFAQLQKRMAGAPATVARLARRLPASYVAFDVLAHDGVDLRGRPYLERRQLLEQLAVGWSPPMNLTPTTTDPAVAAQWFDELGVAGIEGLVIKGAAQRYAPGRRDWLKVKHRTSVEVICAAVIGPLRRPAIVVAGLVLDGELRIVGRTVPLSVTGSKELGTQLVAAAEREHPWPARVTSAAVNGWGGTSDPVDLTLVQPIVVEVTADAAWSGRSFRHVLRHIRARPDVDVDDVMPPPR